MYIYIYIYIHMLVSEFYGDWSLTSSTRSTIWSSSLASSASVCWSWRAADNDNDNNHDNANSNNANNNDDHINNPSPWTRRRSGAHSTSSLNTADDPHWYVSSQLRRPSYFRARARPLLSRWSVRNPSAPRRTFRAKEQLHHDDTWKNFGSTYP